MKVFNLLLLILLIPLFLHGQMQQGRVKTRGKMIDGKHVQGKGLPGTIVSIKDHTDIGVKNSNGSFSFPITDEYFLVEAVTNRHYTLVDADAIPKMYTHSADTLYIVMETPEQQWQDRLESERKIRRTLQRQLQKREEEIEMLKATNQISQKEYQQALQELYSAQEKNEQLISEMSKCYSQIDYDQLDVFYRQVNFCIEQGDLVKADSLLRSCGDIYSQVMFHLESRDVIKQKEKELKHAKEVHRYNKEELARRCYSYYETFKMQHKYDSAAYYIELRAQIDTMNIDWLAEVVVFSYAYLGNYNKSLNYLQKIERQLSDISDIYADSINLIINHSIGAVYKSLGAYDKALEYHEKALEIRKLVFGDGHPDVATSYNNIGSVYSSQGAYDKALKYHEKALEIRKLVFGDEHPDVAASYSAIASIYISQENYLKALENEEKVLAILKTGFDRKTIIEEVELNIIYLEFLLTTQMKESVFTINIIKGDSQTNIESFSGEYIVLKFADWDICDTESLLDTISRKQKCPQLLVIMNEFGIFEYQIEGQIEISMKRIGWREKRKILREYKVWKERQRK